MLRVDNDALEFLNIKIHYKHNCVILVNKSRQWIKKDKHYNKDTMISKINVVCTIIRLVQFILRRTISEGSV